MGEVDSIKHCEKRLPLKGHSFRETSNFPPIWFRDLIIRFWGLEIKYLKAHNFKWQACHYYLIISQLRRRQIELKCSQLCYSMHMLNYTKWKTGLRQLPIVSSVFKTSRRLCEQNSWWSTRPVFDICMGNKGLAWNYCPSQRSRLYFTASTRNVRPSDLVNLTILRRR